MRTLMALPESGLKRNKGHVRAAAIESLFLGNVGMARVSLQVPLLPLVSLVGLILFPFSHLYCKHPHLSCQSPKSGFVVDFVVERAHLECSPLVFFRHLLKEMPLSHYWE